MGGSGWIRQVREQAPLLEYIRDRRASSGSIPGRQRALQPPRRALRRVLSSPETPERTESSNDAGSTKVSMRTLQRSGTEASLKISLDPLFQAHSSPLLGGYKASSHLPTRSHSFLYRGRVTPCRAWKQSNTVFPYMVILAIHCPFPIEWFAVAGSVLSPVFATFKLESESELV